MIKNFERLLGRFSWRTKMLALTGIMALGSIFIGTMGALSIINLSEEMHKANTEAAQRMNTVEDAQVALLSMGVAQIEVIARVDKKEIRMAAVGAIKAASDLEEKIVKLREVLPGDKNVDELLTLIKEINPKRMEVIKLARRDRDAEAMRALEVMEPLFRRVDELSEVIILEQRAAMDAQLLEIQ